MNILENFREWQETSLIWCLPASVKSEFTLFPLLLFMHFGVSLSFSLPLKVLLSFAFRCQIHSLPCLSSWFFSLVLLLFWRGGRGWEVFIRVPQGFLSLSNCVYFFFLEFSYSADTLIHCDLHSPGTALDFGSRASFNIVFFRDDFVSLWHFCSKSAKTLFLLTLR